jgi:hypothetical protein
MFRRTGLATITAFALTVGVSDGALAGLITGTKAVTVAPATTTTCPVSADQELNKALATVTGVQTAVEPVSVCTPPASSTPLPVPTTEAPPALTPTEVLGDPLAGLSSDAGAGEISKVQPECYPDKSNQYCAEMWAKRVPCGILFKDGNSAWRPHDYRGELRRVDARLELLSLCHSSMGMENYRTDPPDIKMEFDVEAVYVAKVSPGCIERPSQCIPLPDVPMAFKFLDWEFDENRDPQAPEQRGWLNFLCGIKLCFVGNPGKEWDFEIKRPDRYGNNPIRCLDPFCENAGEVYFKVSVVYSLPSQSGFWMSPMEESAGNENKEGVPQCNYSTAGTYGTTTWLRCVAEFKTDPVDSYTEPQPLPPVPEPTPPPVTPPAAGDAVDACEEEAGEPACNPTEPPECNAPMCVALSDAVKPD